MLLEELECLEEAYRMVERQLSFSDDEETLRDTLTL